MSFTIIPPKKSGFTLIPPVQFTVEDLEEQRLRATRGLPGEEPGLARRAGRFLTEPVPLTIPRLGVGYPTSPGIPISEQDIQVPRVIRLLGPDLLKAVAEWRAMGVTPGAEAAAGRAGGEIARRLGAQIAQRLARAGESTLAQRALREPEKVLAELKSQIPQAPARQSQLALPPRVPEVYGGPLARPMSAPAPAPIPRRGFPEPQRALPATSSYATPMPADASLLRPAPQVPGFAERLRGTRAVPVQPGPPMFTRAVTQPPKPVEITPTLPGGRVPQAPGPAMFSQMRLVKPEPVPPPASPVEIPKNPQQIIFPVGGGASPQAVRQTQTRTTILNRVFGGGLGDKLRDAETVERQLLGPRNYELRTGGFMKLSPNEDRNLFQVLEGRAAPISQRVQEFARRLRGMFTEDAQDYVAQGARIKREATIRDPNTGQVIRKGTWDPFTEERIIANYAPRFIDPKGVLGADPQRFARDIAQANPGMAAKDAADIVALLRNRAEGIPQPRGLTKKDIKQNLSKGLPPLQGIKQEIIDLVERDAFLPAHLHARTGLRLPDYAYRPMREAVPIYLEQAARERAFLRTFGANADDIVEQQITQLGGRSNPHVALAEEVWDLYRGRFIEPESSRRLKQTGRTLNSLASGLLLGVQTAVQQPSQYGNLIAQFGGRNVARGLARIMQRGGMAEAERAGTFVRSLMDELALLDRLSPTATKADVAEQAAAGLARTTVRLSGIRSMDEFPRAVGFHTAKAWILDLQRAAALGNERAVKELAKVRLSPTASLNDVVAKAADLSAEYNITTGFADMPHILSTPIGTFARGLQTFMIQQSRLAGKFLRRAAQGEVAPLLRYLIAAQPIGEGIGTAVRFLQGRSSDRPGGTTAEFFEDLAAGRVPTATVIRRTADNFAWSATFGLAQRLIETASGAFGIPMGTGASRTMSGTEVSSRLLGTAAGAGVSSGLELAVGAPAGVVRAALDPDEAARHLSTTGRIVTRRLPGIGGIVAPRVFRSEVADRRMATEAIARALRRNDRQEAVRWHNWFTDRYPGKTITDAAIDKAR